MSKKKRKGFTLIELLVVIAIIALLLSVIMPSLRLAKEQARKVVCKSNLGQLAKAVEMYEMDSDYKRFSVRNNDADTSKYWMGKIAPYAGNESYGERLKRGEKIDVLLCPSAPYNKFEVNSDLVVASGQIGTAAAPWEWNHGALTSLSTIGSYTINGGVAYDWAYENPASSLYDAAKASRAYENWMRTPPNVPVFACGRWTIGWPTSMASAWPSIWGAPGEIPEYVFRGEQMIVNNQDMDRFCIDRHNFQTNLVFKDLSVDTKKLEDLWVLRWNKEWQIPSFSIRVIGR